MRPIRATLVILSAGLLTFGIVFTFLQVTRSEAAPSEAINVPAPTAIPLSPLVSRMASDAFAVGVPIGGSATLLRDVQPGDRLDVTATLASPGGGGPVTAVVVRGARVLEPPSSSDPLLLEVSAPDAMALAHLVLGGTRLGFIVWSASGANSSESPPLDEQAARSLLGLTRPTTPVAPAPTPTSVSVAASPTPASQPPAAVTMTPNAQSARVPRFGGFMYAVQDGDTWDTIASLFGLSVVELKHWNESTADLDLAPRTLVFIPR